MSDITDDPFIVFGAPDIHEDEINEIEAVMRSGWLGTGPRVAKFESLFADYKAVDASQVAAVNSCTAALHVSMIAAGLGPGDEVVTTAMTFCATVNAIIHSGATPVLADIDPKTLNIDCEHLREKITDRTRAIVPVHFAGRACDMDEISSIASKHDLVIIEDCAHAIEAEWRGKKAGTFGDYGCFSFYVTKNITTGEGGMVIAQSEADIERIKVLSLHGMSKDAWKRFSDNGYRHYQVVEAGFKYNMMDLQAAIGLHQMARVDTAWHRRQEIWNYYQEALKHLPIVLPAQPERDTRHGYHLFTVHIDKDKTGIERDTFMDRMTAEGIGVGVHYLSLANHPHYQQRFGWQPDDYPVAEYVSQRTVSLPLSSRISNEDVERVINAVQSILSS